MLKNLRKKPKEKKVVEKVITDIVNWVESQTLKVVWVKMALVKSDEVVDVKKLKPLQKM